MKHSAATSSGFSRAAFGIVKCVVEMNLTGIGFAGG